SPSPQSGKERRAPTFSLPVPGRVAEPERVKPGGDGKAIQAHPDHQALPTRSLRDPPPRDGEGDRDQWNFLSPRGPCRPAPARLPSQSFQSGQLRRRPPPSTHSGPCSALNTVTSAR